MMVNWHLGFNIFYAVVGPALIRIAVRYVPYLIYMSEVMMLCHGYGSHEWLSGVEQWRPSRHCFSDLICNSLVKITISMLKLFNSNLWISVC